MGERLPCFLMKAIKGAKIITKLMLHKRPKLNFLCLIKIRCNKVLKGYIYKNDVVQKTKIKFFVSY